MSNKYFIFVFLFVLGCTDAPPIKTSQPADINERAQNIWQSIVAGDAIQFGRDFDSRVDQIFPKGDRASFLENLKAKYGRPLQLNSSYHRRKYSAIYPMDFQNGKLEMNLSLNEKMAVIGITISPVTESSMAQFLVHLGAPMHGPMNILAGPGEKDENPRADGENQVFAVDLTPLNSVGQKKIPGDENKSYACFGREVLAPAAGVVLEAVDGVRDNPPGEANPFIALGNAIMLSIKPKEFIVLAHLQQGSIRVHPGQKVRAGQLLAHCGNSGNSKEPHLRIYAQDEGALSRGIGLRIVFDGIYKLTQGDLGGLASISRSGRALVKNYFPVTGEIIEAAPAERLSSPTPASPVERTGK